MAVISATIKVRLPVINGYVQIPDDQILHPTTLTPDDVVSLIPGSTIMFLGIGEYEGLTIDKIGSGETYRKLNGQLFVELPEFDRAGGYPSDWYQTLRSAA